MADFEKQKELLKMLRIRKILKARESFWEFCKLEAPDYYIEHRTHLVINCLFLEAFYYKTPRSYISPYRHTKRIRNGDTDDPKKDPVQYEIQGNKTIFTCDLVLEDESYGDTVNQNEPPRHGKSRTLFLYTAWRYGKDVATMVMTVCHKKDLAIEFSTYTRDTIEEQKTHAVDIIYNDVFPNSVLQYGNKSKGKWSLEGRFHSYKGCGILAGEAGMGSNLLIYDDTVKGSIEAFNPDHLEKVISSAKNNYYQRLEKGGDVIINATRWSVNDQSGDALAGPNGHKIKTLIMEAWTEEQGMLCDDFLDRDRYLYLESELDEMIFQANYHQRPPDMKGKMYKQFLEYEELPVMKEYIFRGDTADEGDDFLCVIVAGISMMDEPYLLDVYYTDAGQEVTIPETAELLVKNKLKYDFISGKIEHNNGGGGFAREVSKIIETDTGEGLTEIGTVPTKRIDISTFTQTKNKLARINSASRFIQKHVFYPVGWKQRWPKFAKHMDQFMRDGKNQVDDAPDTLTMIAEAVEDRFPTYEEMIESVTATRSRHINKPHFG